MNEKKQEPFLPTAERLEKPLNPFACRAISHDNNRLRKGLLKLGLLTVVAIYLFASISNKHHSHHGHHREHLTRKFKFEKHMQSDVDQLVAGSLESNILWDRLAEMTDTFGPRITGSDALEKSIDWVIRKLKADNLSVTTEEVVVDYWQRHQESLHFLSPTRGPVPMHILGLGYSVSTPDPINGLEAEVIVVHSKDELEQLGQRDEVRGKIVLWNNPFTSYTENALYRAFGAVWAQGHGAVASLVRSVTPFSLQTPHTGVAEIARIPMAAISVEDADLLERSLNRHKQDPETFPEWPKVKLIMGASTELESKISRNIIIELKGREKPEEIVVVGGHIDSWDVGSGAVDDGAGCFIAWETLRQLSRLERPPRRTVRVVFWTAEENTSAGGVVYARNHPEKDSSRHVFAFESDTGVFDPYGISFAPGTAKDGKKRDSAEFLTAAGEYFMGRREDLGYPGAGRHVLPNPFGADIEPLCKRGVACAEFVPADPFPLPYSTSPYAIKYGTGNRHHEDDMQSMVKDHNNGKEYNPFHNYDYQNNNSKKHHHHRSRSSNIHDKYRRPVDTGYFYYHHSEADSMGAFTPDQLKRSAAVMAIWTYIAAESPIEF